MQVHLQDSFFEKYANLPKKGRKKSIARTRFVKFGKVNRDFAEKLFLSKNNLGNFDFSRLLDK